MLRCMYTREIPSMLRKLQGLGERDEVGVDIAAEVTEQDKHRLREQLEGSESNVKKAYWRAYHFWWENGARLVLENGQGSFHYDFVLKMHQLHAHIVGVMDKLIAGDEVEDRMLAQVESMIGGILRLQRMSIIQFAFCQDKFNRYLQALGILESVLQHRHW